MLHRKLSKIFDATKNEDGIALVTSLMMTLISLAIIMSVMYLITSSIQHAGANKRYKSALEAAYGGTELVVKDLIPMIMRNYSSTTLTSDIASEYSGVVTMSTTQKCLQAKLTQSTANWPAACNASINPKTQPDVQLKLPSTNGVPYTVYSKIVDTVAGNSDTSGLSLEGSGVAEAVSTITPQHFPYIYRLEVQGERSTNAVEKSNISVLYAY